MPPTWQRSLFFQFSKKSKHLSTKTDFKELLEAYFMVTKTIIFMFQNGVQDQLTDSCTKILNL